jgi:hypothetical protein
VCRGQRAGRLFGRWQPGACACTGRAITAYRQIGCDLIAAKALCRHGEWLPWLKANVPFTPRQAQNYMKLAKCEVTSHLDEQWRVILGNDEPDSESELHNHRAQGTGENEWYTPAEVLEVARAGARTASRPCFPLLGNRTNRTRKRTLNPAT